MQGVQTILSYLQTAVVLTLVLTVLVAVHELGHFWFARAFGMKVDAFAVMMGGIRQTSLKDRLVGRMANSVWVAVAYLGAVFALLIGAFGEVPWLYTGSLALVSVVLPVWVACRLGTLYHLKPNDIVRTMGMSWGAFLVLLFVATRFQGVVINEVLSLLFFASLIGLLFVYYAPVLKKPEDSPMGHGVVQINGEEVPVRFRPLWSRTDRHGTEFSMLLLPLGGFAAIRGMHPKDDGSEVKVEGGFYSKSPLARFLVLFAGPLFSVLLGVVLLTGYFMLHGQEKPVDRVEIGTLVVGSPGQKAGLQVGDQIVSVEGQPVARWFDFVRMIRDRQEVPVSLQVRRGGERLQVSVTPKRDQSPTPVLGPDGPTGETKIQAKIGAAQATERVQLGFAEAVRASLVAPVAMVGGLAGLATNPSRAKDEMGGTASIVNQAHKATQEGFWMVIRLAALLSISLGVMNLLPIPPLDGGQMVVAFIEMLRGGRRLSIQVQNVVATAGMIAMLALIAFVMFVDVNRFLGNNSPSTPVTPPAKTAP